MMKPMAQSGRRKRATPARENGRAASIHDVASAAKVSIATVSRVLNNPRLVSPETAARVRDVIRRIGYAPNRFAQGLITRRSRVLGIVLPDIHGEFYSELLRGAEKEARAAGYHLLIAPRPPGEAEEPESAFSGLGLVDGLAVMITESASTLMRRGSEPSLPTVILDTDLHGRGVDSVVIDNAGGTREAVCHLLESTSPEALCFVGGPESNFDSQQRATAFRRAIEEAGGQVAPRQIRFGEYSSAWGEHWAQEQVRRRNEAPLGILAGNDEIAVGIIQGAMSAGVRIPEQWRLIGFDDTRLATLIRPRLTTVRVPMMEVGSAAIRLLLRRIAMPDAEITCTCLPTSLVVRESSVAASRPAG
jgi:LacI family transcriptional regulator